MHLIVPFADTLKDFLLSCDGPGRGELGAWRMQTLNGSKLARGQTRSEAAMHLSIGDVTHAAAQRIVCAAKFRIRNLPRS